MNRKEHSRRRKIEWHECSLDKLLEDTVHQYGSYQEKFHYDGEASFESFCCQSGAPGRLLDFIENPALLRALRKLGESQLLMLDLYVHQQLSQQEIARILGMPQTNVSYSLRKIIIFLQKFL